MRGGGAEPERRGQQGERSTPWEAERSAAYEGRRPAGPAGRTRQITREREGRTKRCTEHLPAVTPAAWSLRSRHPSRQRSGAGDRGRSLKNMRLHLTFCAGLARMPSALLLRILLPQDPRQKQVVIRHRGR